MKKIDYSFRPTSYWDHESPVGAIISQVKGQERRKLIREALRTPSSEELPEEIFADEDHQLESLAVQAMGPMWMGGEYLPGYLPGEVEIARIVLASTTQDVYSVRARRRARGIKYRVADEYEAIVHFGQQTSKRPLTLFELTRGIDNIVDEGSSRVDENDGKPRDFTDDIREWMLDDPEGAVDFITVESELYPQLERHYHEKALAWLARHSPGDSTE